MADMLKDAPVSARRAHFPRRDLQVMELLLIHPQEAHTDGESPKTATFTRLSNCSE